VALTVVGIAGEVGHRFRFDTGCDTTMVSEDVAAVLGVPAGGTPVGIRGSTGTASGRLVAVTFRFPPDEIGGLAGPVLSSTWIVVATGTNLALLSLHEVLSRFYISTDDTDMYFTNR
jgi:hypothetical protein